MAKRKTTDYQPDPANANVGSERGLRALDDSLSKYGAGRSILVDKNGYVIAGNKTLERAHDLGIEDVVEIDSDGHTLIAVRRTDLDLLTDTKARELAYADNRVAEIDLSWNAEQLLADLNAGADLSQFWREDELQALLDGLVDTPAQDPGPQIDKAAELQQKWQVARGDLWEIGKHLLLCGDSTSADDVARVIAGERAILCVTSPPYWVGKEYEQETTWDEVQRFITDLCATLPRTVSERIVINTGAPPAAHLTGKRAHVRLLIDDYQRELDKHGWLLRYVRIWAKRGGLAHTAPISDCIDQHWEFIGVFYNPENYQGQRRLGEKWATDGIWDDFQGEMSSHGHVAAFPVELPSRNIRLYSDKGDLIYDPFGGSGTTMVACEQLGRACRMIEIAPEYCSVILERMTGLGLTPQRI